MKKVFTLILFSLVLFSCSKEDIASEEGPEIQEKESVKFIYKSSTHLVLLDEDGKIDQSSVSKDILDVINEGYILELNEKDTAYLFDQEDEMNEFITKNYTYSSDTATDKMAGVATCTTYQHWFYGGFPLAGSGNFSYPSLRPFGFNDIISSVIVTNYSNRGYLVKFYKHDNYQGSFFTKIVDPNSIFSLPNFRVYRLNDEISSFTGRYL